jgi:hypothetical protein
MAYLPLSDKVTEKWRKELIELHKRVILDYFFTKGVSLGGKNKFFRLYDYYIDHTNILCYFNKPIRIFVNALITDRLDQIADSFPTDGKTKRKKRKKSSK